LRLKSPQELSDDVLHMQIARVLIELLVFKIFVTHEPVFFEENVRYLVWTCSDPVFLILGSRS